MKLIADLGIVIVVFHVSGYRLLQDAVHIPLLQKLQDLFQLPGHFYIIKKTFQ